MNILLIEDDLDVAASIAEFLEFKNMTVDFAYDVKQAKSRLQGETFDLIIMDINLPDGNGVELCGELIKEHQLQQPIMFLSARGAEKDKLDAFSAGAIDFVVKPFSMLELVARIENICKHFTSIERFEKTIGPLTVCMRTASVTYEQQVIQLNRTGLKIVHALMQSHPKPIGTERMCSIIWGGDVPESNPLRSHVSRINSTFMAVTNNKLINSIRGIGYQLSIETRVKS